MSAKLIVEVCFGTSSTPEYEMAFSEAEAREMEAAAAADGVPLDEWMRQALDWAAEEAPQARLDDSASDVIDATGWGHEIASDLPTRTAWVCLCVRLGF